MKEELRSKVLELVNNHPNPTVNDIKELIETAINDRATVRKINEVGRLGFGSLTRSEKLATRRMMSRSGFTPA